MDVPRQVLIVAKNYYLIFNMSKNFNFFPESSKPGHLLIGAGNQLIDYYHEILGKPKMTGSVTLKHVTALAYNSITGIFANFRTILKQSS